MAFSSIKTSLNLLLMIALVSMQLSSTHFHVAEHHQHDGSHHAHNAKAHSHALSDHHQDAFDSTLSSANNLVVEMAQESTLGGTYQFDDQLIATHTRKLLNPIRTTIKQTLPRFSDHPVSWLHYSTVRSRAPPTSLV